MRKNIWLLAIAVVVACLFCSCKKNGGMEVSNISYTACKMNTDKDALKGYEHADSVSVRYDNGTVYVTHYNLLVNCAFEESGIVVDIDVDDSRIVIKEQEDPNGPLAHCICETDNSFQINNVPAGTYTLVFENWYAEPHEVVYTFQ